MDAGPTAPASRSRPGRIVVADDDPDMRALLSRLLRADRHEVAEAANGFEALELMMLSALHDLPTTLLLCDVRMPFIGGLEVLRRVRAWGWSLPVILVTAFADESLHRNAAARGATAILDKPFEPETLRKLVSSALASSVR